MIKILLLFITLFFSFNLSVDAALCDKEYIDNLKELAEQVDVNYEYIDYSEEILSGSGGSYSTNRYKVLINLISNDLYLNFDDNVYNFSQDNNGIVTFYSNSGPLEFSIHTKICADYRLRKINLTLPKFNVYSYKDECRKLSNYELDVCDPWYQGTITDISFYNSVNKYLNNVDEEYGLLDKIIIFLEKNLFYIICGFVVLILFIILFVNYRKKSVLE